MKVASTWEEPLYIGRELSARGMRIADLRGEARRAGDAEMVAICERALDGATDALEICERTIAAAQAMDDGDDDTPEI